MGTFSTRTALLGLALLVCLLPALGAAEGSFKQEKKRYLEYLERPSLYMRNRGRVKFAMTGDERALAILAKSYAKTEVPKDQVRYLLASMCADHFRAAPHVPLFRAWRQKHAKPRDAWLWYRSLEVELKLEGPDELLAIVSSRRDATLRMAALRRLAEAGDENVLRLCSELLAALPVKPFDRMLVLEGVSDALYLRQREVRSKPWRAAARALITRMDDKETELRSRLVIARRMARTLHQRELPLTSKPWLDQLDGRKRTTAKLGPPPARPRFVGVEATGNRIAYVIDLSDSMLTPLTGKEIDDLKKAPPETHSAPKKGPRKPVVTGGSSPKPGKDPPKKPKEEKPPRKQADAMAQLPWDRIRTRFDAARELLKLSLASLHPEQAFCVIVFGSDAELLRATPGLRRATPANVGKAIAELDAIQAGPKKRGRPYGTLKGHTNMHGGLHRAFKVTNRGLVKQHEYVDAGAFAGGCDTIFLLSDGDPTWDDWPEMDLLEKDDKSGDPESRAKVKQQKQGHFYGPYAIANVLVDDLKRLNLFRKVEIHCIGLGESDPRLLTKIATIGLGRAHRIGAKK